MCNPHLERELYPSYLRIAYLHNIFQFFCAADLSILPIQLLILSHIYQCGLTDIYFIY